MTSAQIRQSFLDFFHEKKHIIVPSSPLLPDAPNLLFTNAGMNQFVPIFLGQQKPTWNPPRVTDTQKCIRAGGKHNDLEDVGLDTYHHTFFEMLGNWSFGDYFKREAIEWAWELIVERWKFPAQRLYATVYKPGQGEPSEFDQEAYDHWARLFQDTDLDPKIHVLSSGKADNFWMMGDTGPCGPCSELHVDLTPDGDTRGALVNKNDPRCIEIWNLVFIQFNANADGKFTPLPQRHVDTGMGFERATAIIQGTKNLTDFSGMVSNYETDIFRPIFDEIEKLSGKKYANTLPKSGVAHETEQEKTDIAFRVIADHIRALSFAIADGIIPSNDGRGYVLRRILRRAVRYGRSLDFHEPFFFKLVDVVARTMGDVFPEVRSKKKTIQETIRREEESFNKTLDAGIEQFNEFVALTLSQSVEFPSVDLATAATRRFHMMRTYSGEPREGFCKNARAIFPDSELSNEAQLSGEHVFKLYDTYGFPLDLTELMARERGLTVDVAAFDTLMEEQRKRGRGSQKKSLIEVLDQYDTPTEFVGYDELSVLAQLLGTIMGPSRRQYAILDRSPFYAEMGGQVGDRGRIRLHDGRVFNVINTTKQRDTFYHEFEAGSSVWTDVPSEPVDAVVDAPRRKLIQGHHTVTHLLHWALHEVVSKDAAQKGSYVGSDKLTFDFSSAPLTPLQKRDVEKLVNEKIAENAEVSPTEIPYAEAKKRKEIQQFFGEKYGDKVRVIQIGGEPNKLNGYSMELCGGTHVRSTSEIGPFRIVKEEAIAAGTRRIEAVAGDAARVWAREEAKRQQEKFETLSRKKPDVAPLPVFTDTVQTTEMLKQIDARAAHLEKLDVDVREWEKKHAKEAEADLRSRGAQIANELLLSKVGQKICVAKIPDADGKLLQAVADALKQKFDGPIVLAGEKEGNVALVAVVPRPLTTKIQANKIIQTIAPIVGGKGGGRPENAQGGGTDASKIDEALTKARELLS
jgi:alanyl-tRNA synthetase